MAEQAPIDEEEHLTSFFPAPPPFFKHFTDENIKLLEDAKANAASDDSGNDGENTSSDLPHLTTAQLLALPTEVRYLIPPEPPAEDEEYTVFQQATKLSGHDMFQQIIDWIQTETWNEEQDAGPLKAWKYEQLYPSTTAEWSSVDRQNYLFRFLRSMVLSFIELLGIVAMDPSSEESNEKMRNILTLVLNMHALINEYRPHQARETLIRLMEQQVARKRAEVEGVKKMAVKVKETLEGFEKQTPQRADLADTGSEVPLRLGVNKSDKQREMWAAMDEILGH
jgi:mediator of RNA polymerase II transcription subunit 7